MMTHRRLVPVLFNAPLVLEPPRHCGLSTIALIPGRHLIGTGVNCGIRLQAEGVHEQHALIVVGESRTVVKAMDSRTWINDGPVTEMALRNGDRLSIGPLTFRVRNATPDETASFASTLPTESAWRTVEVPFVPSTVSATTDHEPVVDEQSDTQDIPQPEVADQQVSQKIPEPVAAAIENQNSQFTSQPESAPVKPVTAVEQTVLNGSVSTTHANGHAVPSDVLTSRLDEIEQRLADLQLTTETWRPQHTFGHSAPNLGALADLQKREDELQHRAEEVAAQSSQLESRAAELDQRELAVAKRQQQLVAEADRLAAVAESARRKLAEEQHQLSIQWKDWDEKYQRMASELGDQFASIESQRAELRSEAERLAGMRSDLQRLRSDYEQERRSCAADRARAASEMAEVRALRAQLESERLQHSTNTEELQRRLESDRRVLDKEREKLDAQRAELQQDLRRLTEDRASQSRYFEEQSQLRSELRASIEEDRRSLQIERQDLESQRRDFESVQSNSNRSVDELDEFRREAETTKAKLLQAEHELEQLKKTLEEQTVELTRQRDRHAIAHSELRTRLVQETVCLQSERRELESLRTEMEDLRRSLHDHSGSECLGMSSPNNTVTPAELDIAELLADQGLTGPQSVIGEDETSSTIVDGSQIIPATSIDSLTDWNAYSHSALLNYGDEQLAPLAPQSINEKSTPAILDDASHVFGDDDQCEPDNGLFNQQNSAARLAVVSQSPGHSDPWETIPAIPQWGGTSAPQSVPLTAFPADSDPWSIAASAVQSPRTTISSIPDYSSVAEDLSSIHEPNDPWAAQMSTGAVAVVAKPIEQEVVSDEAVTDTLAAVNRDFGVALTEPSPSGVSSLPSWWKEAATEPVGDARAWQVSPSIAEGSEKPKALPPQSSSTGEGGDDDLRSQLARLFDLPAEVQREASNEPAAEIAEAVEPPEQHAADTDAPAANPVAESQREDHHTGVDDSVEAFMARLLARSRNEQENAAPVAAPTTQPAPERAVEAPATIEVHDPRALLLTEPKHKQDKQAVRENLQSFRQVAHLSARSALARHSIRQLRNATIAKGVLLSIAVIATVVYVIQPLVGKPAEIWKVTGCSLAALLSGLEFARSWKQLRRPIRSGPLSSPSQEVVTDSAVVQESSEPAQVTEAESTVPPAAS